MRGPVNAELCNLIEIEKRNSDRRNLGLYILMEYGCFGPRWSSCVADKSDYLLLGEMQLINLTGGGFDVVR